MGITKFCTGDLMVAEVRITMYNNEIVRGT